VDFGSVPVVFSTVKLEFIPKLKICFLSLVFRIINQAHDPENNPENS